MTTAATADRIATQLGHIRDRHQKDAMLAEHVLEPLYAPASEGDCGHPEMPQGTAAGVEWARNHPFGGDSRGSDDGGRMCLLTPSGHYCVGCTKWMGEHVDLDGDYVRAEECPIRSALARVLASPDSGPARQEWAE